LAKERGAVERFRIGTACTPVPDREMVSGAFSALELTVRVPVLMPAALGVNTMFNVHVPWSARDAMQVLFEAI